MSWFSPDDAFEASLREEIGPMGFSDSDMTRAYKVFRHLDMRSCDDVIRVQRADVKKTKNAGKVVLQIFDALRAARDALQPMNHCPTCRCAASPPTDVPTKAPMQRQRQHATPVPAKRRPPAPVIVAVNDSVDEFAARHNVSSPMTRKMIRVGVPVHIGDGHEELIRLPAFNIGARVLIPRDAADALMARLRNAPPRPIKRRAPEKRGGT